MSSNGHKRLRAPIRWFGGKGLMLGKLLPLIPPHDIYVEVFGGGASLLLAKEPSKLEVYNDLDSGLVNLFRVLRDPEKFERFHRLVSLTPFSREEFYIYRKNWNEPEDDVERAHRFFVVARMSFSGIFGNSWHYSLTSRAKATSAYLSAIDMLPEIHRRIMPVQIEHDDFRKIIERYDTPETFFYLDPPYIHATRRGGKYRHEMTEDDHRDLVDLLLRIKGKAMLSGYRHPIYEPLEQAGWQRLDFRVACSAAGRTRLTGIKGPGAALKHQPRIESVWLNYPAPSSSDNQLPVL